MPKGAARTAGSSGELISHFTGVRLRVVGFGDLNMRLISQDAVRDSNLESLTLQVSNRISPFRLANFMEQRAQLEIKTTEINHNFSISRIIIYSKPTFTMYPA